MSNNLRRRILRAESTIDSAIVTPDAINAARHLWRSTGQLPEGAKLREAVLRIENA